MLKKRIKITLKSNICPASGYSYAGIIDTDACYDEFGLPYIPGRRIKGCLREVAELLGEDAQMLFGEGGQGFERDCTLVIGNAHVENYDALKGFFEQNPGKVSKERILNRYTAVRARTSLEDGVAKDGSLRFIRTIGHYDPCSGEELCFWAPVEIWAGDAEKEETLYNSLLRCVKGLRHLGYNRNRGLGNVKCILTDYVGKKTLSGGIQEENNPAEGMEDKTLKYVLKTDAPLIISQNGGMDTGTMISGRAMLGFFASRYLRTGRAADETFEDFFLRKKLFFSPLYPSNEKGDTYVPVPEYLGILKKTKYLVNNSLAEIPDCEDPDADIRNGNQAKKLRGKFVCFRNGRMDLKEVDTEIIYHHRRENGDTKALLYSHRAISPNQYYVGTVTGPAAVLEEFRDILSEGPVTLGKSLSAQYGKCTSVSLKIMDPEGSETIHVEDGDRILVVLESDGIFLHNGNYTDRIDEIAEEIRRQFEDGFADAISLQPGDYAEIRSGQVSGYYGVCNLKRQAVPAALAGSGVSFIVSGNGEIPSVIRIGENTGEGFGIARVLPQSEEWVLQKPEKKAKGNAWEDSYANELENIRNLLDQAGDGIVRQLLYQIMMEIAGQMAREEAAKVRENRMNPAAVGRLALMLQESENEASCSGGTVKELLDKRINSIKDIKKREEASDFVERYYYWKRDGKDYVKDCFEERDGESLRVECLRQALVWLKYKTKEKG